MLLAKLVRAKEVAEAVISQFTADSSNSAWRPDLVVALALLEILDSTPLTAELLIKAGGVRGADYCSGYVYFPGRLWVRVAVRHNEELPVAEWCWLFDHDLTSPLPQVPKQCAPHTLGELWQLLVLLESRHVPRESGGTDGGVVTAEPNG